MSGELFKYMAQVNLTHVPYRGAAPAFTDVIAGRVDCTFAVMASGLPLARSGQLRALGVTTAGRVPTAPEVPSIAEAGVPGYDTSSWFAFFVPAKTPPEKPAGTAPEKTATSPTSPVPASSNNAAATSKAGKTAPQLTYEGRTIQQWQADLKQRGFSPDCTWLFDENLVFEQDAAALDGYRLGYQVEFTPPPSGSDRISYEYFADIPAPLVLYRLHAAQASKRRAELQRELPLHADEVGVSIAYADVVEIAIVRKRAADAFFMEERVLPPRDLP